MTAKPPSGRITTDPIMLELIDIRVSRGISQFELGERAGYFQQVIDTWERGVRSPNLRKTHDLANALGYKLCLCPIKPQNGP